MGLFDFECREEGCDTYIEDRLFRSTNAYKEGTTLVIDSETGLEERVLRDEVCPEHNTPLYQVLNAPSSRIKGTGTYSIDLLNDMRKKGDAKG